MSNRFPTEGELQRAQRGDSRGDQAALPTITDVAARAGVSKASVSRVINKKDTVDPAIATRVNNAIAALGYRPSSIARGLSLGRTNTVAVVVPDLENPMFQEILRGVTQAAAVDGYRVLVADTEEDPADEAAAAREARRRCDALVLCSPRLPEPELRELLKELHPVVLVNRELIGSLVPSVSIDYASGMETILTELHALGHRRIAYLAGPAQSDGDRLRRAGITRSLRALAGMSVSITGAGSRLADGAAAADEVLSGGVTAVVAFNDLVALGLLSALRQRGVDVPGELSVIGFDDIPFAAYSIPALSTVSVPRRELGLEAWNRLRETIAGTGGQHPLTFRPRYVPRGSAIRRAAGSEQAGRAGGVAWTSDGADQTAVIDGATVVREVSGVLIETQDSPRPYLHPVMSLGGLAVTEIAPGDHRHHLGVSNAVADVDGVSYWGGRTYVRETGSTMLDNHGTQRVTARASDGGSLVEELVWTGRDGSVQLHEERATHVETIVLPGGASAVGGSAAGEAATAGGRALAVTVASELIATEGPFSIGSPATNGRAGAGYGGLFWRLPNEGPTTIITPDAAAPAVGNGEAAAHYSSAAWLAVVQERPEGTVSVLFTQPEAVLQPWFVRCEEYVGVCAMLAPVERVHVAAGERLGTAITGVVVDGAIDAAAAHAIFEQIRDGYAGQAERAAELRRQQERQREQQRQHQHQVADRERGEQ